MSGDQKAMFWEVACERDGEPYCSSIVEAASEAEAVRNFQEESGLAP